MEKTSAARAQRFDSIPLDQTYFTKEGYLIDHPIVTSAGIFEYANPDGSIRRELRLPEEVFAPESLESYKGKPVIITHNAGYVDKENVEDETIGTILSEGYRDGDHVRAEIIIHNTDAMKSCGLRELSLGYNLRLEETPGVWNGQPYDAIQRDIAINHLALVRRARAGEQARLNIDAQKTTATGGKTMSEKNDRTDGMMNPELASAVEAFRQRRAERIKPAVDAEGAEPAGGDTAAQEAVASAPGGDTKKSGAQLVRDRRDRRDADGDPEDMDKAMGMIAQQDEDIDTLLAIIDCLTAGNVDSGDKGTPGCGTDSRSEGTAPENDTGRADSAGDFRELLRIVRIGDRLNMDGLESMSVRDAKGAILKKLKPALHLDGKSTAYVNAAFDMAVSDIKDRKDTNYQRQQMMNRDSHDFPGETGSAVERRQKMIDRRMKEEI